GTHQYLAFYDSDHQMTVAKRKLGESKWDFETLPEKVGWDTHNKIVIFRDRQGYLHVTGNMHNDPLNYYRSAKPGDIHSFQAIHKWSGFKEKRVTYPKLLKLRDGSCHMMYRHGGSGNGMRILVHYDEKTKTWTGPNSAFISGMQRKPPCNAYPFGPIREDRNGVLHITWCWRETPDVLTNFDICYAKSTDGGYHWKSWGGKEFALPITPKTAEVVDPIKQRSGLINGGSLATDSQGRPYIGYTRFDGNKHNQMYIATPVGGKWKIIQLTNWKEYFWFEGRGSIPGYPPIPRVSIDGSDTIHVRYSFSLVEPKQGVMAFTREELISKKPGGFAIKEAEEAKKGIANIRATCIGPLPKGEAHYMVQKNDRPNRDRKPENPLPPQMIYVYEVKK
ncbi:hypothetical protein GF373_06825, partial [bacterium]|nr:hypothetical protein [bacterium]